MNGRLQQLRQQMAERQIDAYLIPTSDFHESEYVGDYFKCREYITGFTGSAGTAIVTASEALMWTDGRYFVQAARQMGESGFTLQKSEQEGVPSIEEYLERALPQGGVLGFDGRVVNSQMVIDLQQKLIEKNIAFFCEEDLIGNIWNERPCLSAEPVWILQEKYAGKSAADKIRDIRTEMKKEKATVHVLTTLDDIAWLLNIRGNDIPYNPMVLSYMVLSAKEVILYVQESVLNKEVREYLENLDIIIRGYNDIYESIKSWKNEKVLLETGKTNYAILNALDESNKIIHKVNPSVLHKAIKNQFEIENVKQAHIKDGVAMTKLIYWLKMNIGKLPMTEISVSDYAEKLRREQDGNLGLSFHTISAYKENAAMCHYSATPESNKELKPEGFYLIDSGGQYYEGTTDITRTIALGALTEEEREHFTLAAMSMLRLGNVKFLHGCRGISLDYVAREPFWSRGLDYNHGTGHGVGYLSNVHERPNGFRYRMVQERMDNAEWEAGMITSDEPGIYIEGSHGIRTENMLVCKKAEKNEYGQFMEFEFLTFVPIDLDALESSLMEQKDRDYLNLYHKEVYDKISPHLTEEERDWLRMYTRGV